MRKYFGTDGVRGKANLYPMTPDFALKLGQAAAKVFRNGHKKHRIVIGKDTRVSSYMFEYAIASGLCSMGMDVVLVGVLPTPAISFITRSLRADAGIVISASHNPYYDNGIKFFSSDGYKLPDELELQIEKIIDDNMIELEPIIGRVTRIETAIGRYVEFAKSSFDKNYDLSGLKIVVDCANGATYKVAPMAFAELGADIVIINDKPNGYNINDNCGAVYPEELAKKVIEVGADVGVSFDGDGDRAIFVDENGSIVDGDYVLGICGRFMKERGLLKNNTLVATVMSNLGFERSLNKIGIYVERCDVGDRYVIEKMRYLDLNLGGEQSGHVIFSDYNTTGDGLITALQLFKVMVLSGKRLSELQEFISTYPQVLKNVSVNKKIPIKDLPKTTHLIKEFSDQLGQEGRIFVRYSGTENKLRVMVEGQDYSKIDYIANSISATAVKEINGWSME
ncbi:MAG: phosphoglucosamine mutase [Calditerrivibrio sp.]|nr:phosphoglucosamine mutase [Calditerrivibrio sp.]